MTIAAPTRWASVSTALVARLAFARVSTGLGFSGVGPASWRGDYATGPVSAKSHFIAARLLPTYASRPVSIP